MDIVEELNDLIPSNDKYLPDGLKRTGTLKKAKDEIERLRDALKWIAECEGGDIFDLWKEMRDTARAALQQKDTE